MKKTYGNTVALESNGDIYSCDHFVYPEHKVGNILQTDLSYMAESPLQIKFGQDKHDNMSVDCRACKHLDFCNGDSPKQRFNISSDGKPNKNYLCAGYKQYFAHTENTFKYIMSKLN